MWGIEEKNRRWNRFITLVYGFFGVLPEAKFFHARKTLGNLRWETLFKQNLNFHGAGSGWKRVLAVFYRGFFRVFLALETFFP
jgi:hypothetical protein